MRLDTGEGTLLLAMQRYAPMCIRETRAMFNVSPVYEWTEIQRG